MADSYFEASARERLLGVVDAGSFREFVPPAARISSPHLAQLDQPVAFDDGVAVGRATLAGRPVLVAAQEGGFLGGAIGEVHGAKLLGLIERARSEKPAAVLFLFDSGGVRLHEANAGLIAVSELIRAVLAARRDGIRFVGLIGGAGGCFGGTGLIARCCDALVMSEEGRLAMSGPEVIETARGVEEFDSRDRALVWRVTGGKHRYLLGEVDRLVDDEVAQFRAAAIDLLDAEAELTLAAVEREHAMLAARWQRFADCDDAPEIWRRLGVADPQAVPLLPLDQFLAVADGCRSPS
ncbi:biotin-independent malonate decarboxylase subunit beta [Azospira restricta]|uniref:Biotin-independent malonate decarboxylase subunit beta n=1 Tax=Azospira restricta TaxID=404405 RepID=A0A974SPR4_9RHOO|nr:biotin-independent malonate decarboxylase subunit beta [Azospira restricta]QRJ64197.1 biotin-independent malonate decarboxylase subunit beta [Azospira restricta]